MSDKVYVGDIGTEIIVNCGQSIVGATATTLEILKPDGTNKSWSATVYMNNYLKYTVKSGDLDIPGLFRVQAKLTLGGWTGRGETDSFRAYPSYN